MFATFLDFKNSIDHLLTTSPSSVHIHSTTTHPPFTLITPFLAVEISYLSIANTSTEILMQFRRPSSKIFRLHLLQQLSSLSLSLTLGTFATQLKSSVVTASESSVDKEFLSNYRQTTKYSQSYGTLSILYSTIPSQSIHSIFLAISFPINIHLFSLLLALAFYIRLYGPLASSINSSSSAGNIHFARFHRRYKNLLTHLLKGLMLDILINKTFKEYLRNYLQQSQQATFNKFGIYFVCMI